MMEKIKKCKILPVILLATMLGGGVPVFIKIGLQDIDAFTYIFLRFSLALVSIIPLLFFQPIRNRQPVPAVIVSLLATLNIILFTYGIRLTNASSSQFIYAVIPILTLVFSKIFLRERINGRKIFGVGIGLIGTFMVIISPGLSTLPGEDITGNLLIFSGAASYAVFTVMSKRQLRNYSPTEITFIFMATTALAGLLFGWRDISSVNIWRIIFEPALFWPLLYVSVLGTAVYYGLYQYVIKVASPFLAATILYLQPVATAIWASIVLKETFDPLTLSGGALALLGVYLITAAGRQ